jgi:hypothetical protein
MRGCLLILREEQSPSYQRRVLCMTCRPVRAGTALAATAAVITLASCGLRATSQTTGPASHTTIPNSVSATNPSGWTVSAHAQALGAGPTVITVTVTVKGPTTVYGGCVPPLTAEFVDTSGQPLSTPTGSGIHCMAITAIDIPQGQSDTYSVQIPAPTGTGSHLIRATVNSRPPTRLPDLAFG